MNLEQSKKLTILIVEDNRSFAHIIRQSLEDTREFTIFGHIPETTEDFVTTVRNNAKTIDVIIADIQLKDAVDGGLVAIKKLQSHGIKIPVVLLTGDDQAVMHVMENSDDYLHVHTFCDKQNPPHNTSLPKMLCLMINFAYSKEKILHQATKRDVAIERAKSFLISEFNRRGYPSPDEEESGKILRYLSQSGMALADEQLITRIILATLSQLNRQDKVNLNDDEIAQIVESVNKDLSDKYPTMEEVAHYLLWVQKCVNECVRAQEKVRKVIR